MDTQPAFGLEDLLTHLITDMAHAVSERAGEPPTQRSARARAAVQTILAFLPRDGIETMLAGQCVMYHELIVDAVHTSLRDEQNASNIAAMDRAFGCNLDRLRRYRADQAEVAPDAPPVDATGETDIADRLRRHQWIPEAAAQYEPAGEDEDAIKPLSEPANHDQYPAAAADAMSGLNRQARRAIGRYSRKLGGLAATAVRTAGSGATAIRNEPPATLSATPAN
jgi:hypothetical protein